MAEPSPGVPIFLRADDQNLEAVLTDFDTAVIAIGDANKVAIKRIARNILARPRDSFVGFEGMASVAGNTGQNHDLAAGRQRVCEDYLFAVLTGKVPLDEGTRDAYRTGLGDLGIKFSFLDLPVITVAFQNGKPVIGRIIMTAVPRFATRKVVMVFRAPAGSDRHVSAINANQSNDRNDRNFRAVKVGTREFVAPTPPPPPAKPDQFFQMKISDKQPDQPGGDVVAKAMDEILKGAKLLSKSKKLAERLEKVGKVLKAAGKVADLAKLVRLAFAVVGVEFIAFDVMDMTRKKGGLFLYFGVAPNVDGLLDVVIDLAADALISIINAGAVPFFDEDFAGKLAEELTKRGFKVSKDVLQKLLGLKLEPPFPLSDPFRVRKLTTGEVDITVTLQDLEGEFDCAREARTLTVAFGEPATTGARRDRTDPRFVDIKSGGGFSISRRFGVTGVIMKVLDIPFKGS